MHKEQLAAGAAAVMQEMAAEITYWTAETWVVALTESVVSAAEVGGAEDDFAVTSEERGALQQGKHLHTWSGQHLSKSKSIYNNLLLPTLPLCMCKCCTFYYFLSALFETWK